MADKNRAIVCVDDEQIILYALRGFLDKEYGREYIIEVAESAEEGLEVLEELLSGINL